MEVPGVGIVVLVGFGMVLTILLMLVLVLSLEGAVFRWVDSRKQRGKKTPPSDGPAKQAAPAPAPAPAPVPVPVPVQTPAPVVEEGIPPEVVAAIAAAVAAMDGGRTVVRSVSRRRTDSRGRWGAAAAAAYTQPF